MQKFRVMFLNRLTNSAGHQFQCLQRIVPIARAKSIERAIEAAQHRFERLERVSNWRFHAQSIEVEPDDNAKPIYMHPRKQTPQRVRSIRRQRSTSAAHKPMM